MWRLLVMAAVLGAVLGAGYWAETSRDGLTRVRLAGPPEVMQFHHTVPYRSIGDVNLGMKRSYVDRLMGGRGQQIREPYGHVDVRYRGAQIEVQFDHGSATNVSTSATSYRLLKSNLGVGSARAAIVRAYRVRCFPDGGVPLRCVTSTRTLVGVPRKMTFWLKRGRAVAFEIGVATSKP